MAVVNVALGETKGISPLRGDPGAPFDWSPDDSSFVLATRDGVVTVSVADGSTQDSGTATGEERVLLVALGCGLGARSEVVAR